MFSEERSNEAFRKVRNRLKKHYPEEIVLACISKLNEQPQDRIEHLRRYPPWRLLLLIKWTFIYGEYLSPYRKKLNTENFNYLLNLVHDFNGSLRLPSEYENIFLFFRNMAFQQFWLQQSFSMPNFARQRLLFGKLESTHTFKIKFLEKCGISISDFIELSTILMTRFTIEKQKSVSIEWFKTVADKYEIGTIRRFFDLLSIDFNSLRRKLQNEKQANRKVSYEAYEKTPLMETPLIRINSVYYPFSPELIARCLETFIYDTLKSDNPNEFMNQFGSVFEKYVGYLISKTGITNFTEKDLVQNLDGTGKVVDYLLIDNGSRIYIDAKGVEMAYLGMVGHQPEIITDKTKTSLIKGISQGIETAKRLNSIDIINETRVEKGNNYLLIVTFKEMFVGNGIEFYNYVAKETLDRLLTDNENRVLIPFQNMYFISIDDFDLLMGGIASREIELTQILEHAIKSDTDPLTMKFTFGQHISDRYPKLPYPSWLMEECKAIIESCRARFNVIS